MLKPDVLSLQDQRHETPAQCRNLHCNGCGAIDEPRRLNADGRKHALARSVQDPRGGVALQDSDKGITACGLQNACTRTHACVQAGEQATRPPMIIFAHLKTTQSTAFATTGISDKRCASSRPRMLLHTVMRTPVIYAASSAGCLQIVDTCNIFGSPDLGWVRICTWVNAYPLDEQLLAEEHSLGPNHERAAPLSA
jgi:hypothetical protein